MKNAKWIAAAALLLAASGCEMLDKVIPSMPFNTPSKLTNPLDPLYEGNEVAPQAVKDLKQIAASSDSVTLAWKNPPDVDLKRIRISWTTSTWASPMSMDVDDVEPGKDGSAVITGLMSETWYTFEVTAEDNDFLLGESEFIEVQTQWGGDTPLPEATIQSAVPGDREVFLTWSNPDFEDFAGVEVTYGAPGIGPFTISPDSLTQTRVTGLTNGIKYTFVIKIIDVEGERSTGVSTFATPMGDVTPPQDININSITKVEGDGKVTLTWTNPPDGDFIGVEVSPKPGTPAFQSAFVNKPVAEVTLTGLTNGEKYFIVLKTRDGKGNQSFGVTVEVLPAAAGSGVDTGIDVYDRLVEGVINEITFENESTVTVVWDVTAEGTYNFALRDLSVLADPTTALPGLLDVTVTAREGGSVAVPWLTGADGDLTNGGGFQGYLYPGRYLVEISSKNSELVTGFAHVQWDLVPGF